MEISPKDAIDNINDRTKAILYVGIGGNTGKLDEVKKICKKYRLKLTLDAAHMSGPKVLKDNSEMHVGFEADVCIFSFQAVKNLPTADSGMVCYKSKRLDLLSNEHYGTPSYWWIIAEANGIGKGSMHIPVGMQIRIPKRLDKIQEKMDKISEGR